MADTDLSKDIAKKSSKDATMNKMFFSINRYETSDGQTREEVGYFSDGENLLNVRGSYSYIGDDGKLVKVNYVADENGYRQSEGVLPPPAAPLPPHVVASLAG